MTKQKSKQQLVDEFIKKLKKLEEISLKKTSYEKRMK